MSYVHSVSLATLEERERERERIYVLVYMLVCCCIFVTACILFLLNSGVCVIKNKCAMLKSKGEYTI